MAALQASSKGLRLIFAAQRSPLSTRLLSTSSPAFSSQPSSSSASPKSNDDANVKSQISGANEVPETAPTIVNKALLPSLDFDPASDPQPRRTGARSAKDSLSSIEKRRKHMGKLAAVGGVAALVAGLFYMGREWEPDEKNPARDIEYSNALEARYGRIRARFGDTLDTFNKPAWTELLPQPQHKPYTLLLSIDDLLVTSTWDRQHGWRTAKRPGVDYFLAYLSQFYEVVIFTSQQSYTAAPIIDKLDPYTSYIAWKLFREGTRSVDGKIVKDLSYLNRDLSKVIMIDTHPDHISSHPENAILLPKWKGDPGDKGLVGLIPFLESLAILQIPDVRPTLKAYEGKDIAVAHAQKEIEMKRLALEEWRKGRHGGRGPSGKGVGGLTFSGLFGGVGSSLTQYDPSLPPPTYLEIKRKEAQEFYLKEQQWIKEHEEDFKRMVEEDRQKAMEMSGTLLQMVMGAPPKEEEKKSEEKKPEAVPDNTVAGR